MRERVCVTVTVCKFVSLTGTTMVVAHTQSIPASASTTPRKNRRKLSKKPTKSNNGTDQDMQDVHSNPPNKLDSTPQDDDELMIDADPLSISQSTSTPAFPPLAANAGKSSLKSETRRIAIPPHRMTPLKKDWINIFGPLTEILGLQVRMNIQRKCVEARVRNHTSLYRPSYLSELLDLETYEGYRGTSEGC